MNKKLKQIIENFEFIDEWEERYRYLIELGNELPPFPEEERTPENNVAGCTSQVWFSSSPYTDSTGKKRLHITGDSDSHIVRGLIAVLLAITSDQTVENILSTDPQEVFGRIGLKEHLTTQRSNGLAAMIGRIRADAQAIHETKAG